MTYEDPGDCINIQSLPGEDIQEQIPASYPAVYTRENSTRTWEYHPRTAAYALQRRERRRWCDFRRRFLAHAITFLRRDSES